MCKTFGVLPNDPLIQALTPIQMEWIIWNQAEDYKKTDDILKGFRSGSDITDAKSAGVFDGLIDKDE